MCMVCVPSHFWFGGQSSQELNLVEVTEEGRDITINGVETVVEDEWWVV